MPTANFGRPATKLYSATDEPQWPIGHKTDEYHTVIGYARDGKTPIVHYDRERAENDHRNRLVMYPHAAKSQRTSIMSAWVQSMVDKDTPINVPASTNNVIGYVTGYITAIEKEDGSGDCYNVTACIQSASGDYRELIFFVRFS